MATLGSTSIIHGISGSMGGLLFRQMNGKTIVSVKSSAPRKQSEMQRQNRDKFRRASFWAKHILSTYPEKKSYYQNIANKLNLPNAYTAAICEYMRKATPKATNRSSFVAKKNNVLFLQMAKPAFKIRQIKVMVLNVQGTVLTEQVISRYDTHKQFHFKWPDDFPDAACLRIITDEPGHNQYTMSLV